MFNLIHKFQFFWLEYLANQLAITCSKLTKETLEQGLKFVQS